MRRIDYLAAKKITKSYRTANTNNVLFLSGIFETRELAQKLRDCYITKRFGSQNYESIEAYEPTYSFLMELRSLDVHVEESRQPDTTGTIIYTDGSKNSSGTGCAWALYVNNFLKTERKYKLASYCSVYQAELLAILKASDYLLSLRSARYKNVSITTDSLSAIYSLKRFRERHPLVIQIKRNLLKLLNEYNLRVTFFKVKAHNGMLGNEHADVLAKQATQVRTRIEYDAAPVSDVLREI